MPTDIAAGPAAYPAGRADLTAPTTESAFSGVSWGAIIAGGIAAAALAMILATLGAGLGLISVSPWPGRGVSLETVSAGVVIWSIVIEIVAFAIGGYLAGRLRTKWANLHGDEVYFRDTAHGFVTWALGSLVGVAMISAMAGAGTVAAGGAAVGVGAMALNRGALNQGAMDEGSPAIGGQGPAAMGANGPVGGMRGNPFDYYVDMLFRPAGPVPGNAATTNPPAAPANGQTTTDQATGGQATTGEMTPPPPAAGPRAGDLGPLRGEIGRIFATSVKDGQITLSPSDRGYIASQIAARTGLSQADAEKRVDDVVNQAKTAMDNMVNQAKQAADDARKAAAGLALWSFVAMLIGAFVASYAATIGGRHRDL